MGRTRLAGLALLGAALLFALWIGGCSRNLSDEGLRRDADAFWNDQLAGNWGACWDRFAPEALARFRHLDPANFQDAAAYGASRARWAAKHPLLKAELLSVTVDRPHKTGKVVVGLTLRGQPHPRQVEQTWRYDDAGKRWLLSAGDEPGT